MDFNLSLYLVTDSDLSRGRDTEWIVKEAVENGVTIVQLREKNASTKEFIEIAFRLKEALKPYNVPLIINDRADVALAVDADGLHIGQSDMSYEVARKLLGKDKIIGLSVESYEQVEEANRLDVDYIGVSPVFSTPTKTNTIIEFGLDGVRKISKMSNHPIVGIGGLNRSNVEELILSGADGAAVVSAIVSADSPAEASSELASLISNAKLKYEKESWADAAWRKSLSLIRKCFTHPFNLEMASGLLPKDKFDYYLIQDIRYLSLLSKDLLNINNTLKSLIKNQDFKNINFSDKKVNFSNDLKESEMKLADISSRFQIFAENTIAYEQTLQSQLIEKYGIALAQCDNKLHSPAINEYLVYTSSLVEQGRVEEAVASHLPCFWIYYELGVRLMSYIQNKNDDSTSVCDKNENTDIIYREWIESYAAAEFRNDAYDYVEICNEVAKGIFRFDKDFVKDFDKDKNVAEKSTDKLREQMFEAFNRACEYELAFWDECYNHGSQELGEIGEFGFIRRLQPKFEHLLKGKNVLGIGDDCAILGADSDYEYLVSTDMLNEGIHFIKNDIDPVELGYKSVAVNVSDIAAMGAEPIGTFLSIGIPKDTSMAFLDGFMEGYHKISEEFSVPLLGGDTTKAIRELTINVGVIGRAKKGTSVLRSGAKIGDYVCVTGFIGDSAAGLKIVLDRQMTKDSKLADVSGINSEDIRYLLSRHYSPSPRVKQGVFLAAHGANSMMDISDGVASDLRHILNASGVNAKIDLSKLPISSALAEQASVWGWSVEDLAVGGGEDYELLLSMPKDKFEACAQEFYKTFGIPLTVIGEVLPLGSTELIQWCRGEEILSLDKKGFNHFK